MAEAARRGEAPTIAELAEVAPADTVVRLDGRGGRLAELVVTGDVALALGAVLEAAPAGGAFFVVGQFGSGKSHLLAALAELADRARPPLAEPAGLAGWDPALRDAAAAARPALVAEVPLVEYRAGALLEDVVLGRAWAALGRPAPPAGTDRRAAWDGLAVAAGETGSPRVVVLLDELSEFLRAKQGPALTEDLRFLQFLGEWARDRPVLVVGALQESLEEVANVSQRELARIRDRYRSLALSMRHVEDLVRGRLVRLRPGAEEWVARAHRELEAAFPGWGVGAERFARCYPLHPSTLALLEGLGFLLSQQRGVVDFIGRQLAGDPAAGMAPWAERSYRDLLTPDRVWDHFRDRLRERVETRRLAETVVPYWERAAAEVFAAGADRDLALRAVKLLCLLAASPLERPRTGPELACLLMARVSALDPSANLAYLEGAVLEPLAARGAYVVGRPGPEGERVWTVELEADAAEVALARVAQARAELVAGDRRVVRTLAELGSSPQVPLQLLAELGPGRRELLWENTTRSALVALVRVAELGPADVAAQVEAARAVGAAGALLVGELELEEGAATAAAEAARALVAGEAAAGRAALWVPAPLDPGAVEVALELHARGQVRDRAKAEGRTEPGGLVEFLERSAAADEAQARELVHGAYAAGEVALPPGSAAVDLPSLAGLPFERALPGLVGPLLARLHPRHREVAPRAVLGGGGLLRQLVVEALSQPRIPAAAARGPLRAMVDNYLVPLGLARRRGDAYVLAPDPARGPAVAELLGLVGRGERVSAAEVVAHLAEGPVGLTEPESLLVLNACLQAGLIEAWRGRRRLDDPLLAVTPSDRLGAGELAEPGVREALARLPAVVGPGPFEPWNAAAQRQLWERARAWLGARREDLAQVRAGLAAMADSPALADCSSAAVAADLARVAEVAEAVQVVAAPVPGLRRLAEASAPADPDALAASSERLAALARFFREERGRLEQALGYLTHPHLELPPSAVELAALRDQVLAAARDVLALAAEDRLGELAALEREFRQAYQAAYAEAHERFYAAGGAGDIDGVRASPAYRALAALAGLGVGAVPDDRVKVDRALAASAPAPCRRRLDLELSWKPRCGCGFVLGTEPAPLDPAALVATAERGVRQHLGELGRPEHRERLERAAADLADLGREELAADLRRLLGLAAEPDSADPAALAHLLAGPLAQVVGDVLAGGRLVVRRDLASLREDLIGRRFPKRRLVELLAAWVDPEGDLPAGGFVEVIDSAEGAAPGSGAGPPLGSPVGLPAPGSGPGAWPTLDARAGATASLLARRFPRLAALLPADRPADAFWLAAWWAGRPGAPAWIPAELLASPDLAPAAEAARADLGALAELAGLDARVGPSSLLGDQVAAALGLGRGGGAEIAAAFAGERLLRHPLRLAAAELARRLAADWGLAERAVAAGAGPPAVAAAHALVAEAELAPVAHLLAAARHLSTAERRLEGASCRELVEDLYPAHLAPVPGLLSRAELGTLGGGVVPAEAVAEVAVAAARLLGAADAALRDHAGAGFPGCLAVWDVGRGVVGPLLRAHHRVAVLLVDAMRADLWLRVSDALAAALPGRPLRQSWAVVPEPTRTAEAVAALAHGRPAPAGSAPGVHGGPGGQREPGGLPVPFAHLGVEADALVGIDRDQPPEAVRELWAAGPRLSVGVAVGVDDLLHRASVELAGLLEEAAGGLARRVLPTLAALPPGVPLVVLADHGFRERASWGRGPGSRWTHGGTSLEECVVPVAVLGPAEEGGSRGQPWSITSPYGT